MFEVMNPLTCGSANVEKVGEGCGQEPIYRLNLVLGSGLGSNMRVFRAWALNENRGLESPDLNAWSYLTAPKQLGPKQQF